MLNVLTVLSMLALEASAFWRLPCRQALTIERTDPLVNFGGVGEHVHTVHGGNKFGQSATEALLLESTCTSCQVKQDHSAYWTPVMYFQDGAGNFNIVNQTGGMLVYYLPRGDDVKAFPPGFRLIAGNPHLRSFPYPNVEKSLWQDSDRTEAALRQKAVGFNCLNYAEPANAALGLRKLPDNMANTCADGLRAEVFFPSCWNGKDLDSDNHRDHMRYPSLMDDGTCPDGFETRLVSLFFETIWDVAAFSGQDGLFAFSSGDPLGYGYHGDFMNAWDVEVLQTAIDTCTSLSGIVEECAIFEQQTEDEMHSCTIKPSINEDVVGPLKEIPGCNKIEYGPEPATEGGCSTDADKDPTEGSVSPTATATATATATKSYASPPASSKATGMSSYKSGSDYGYNPSQEVAPSTTATKSYASPPASSKATGMSSYESSSDYGYNPSQEVAPSTTAATDDTDLVIVTVTTYTTVPTTTTTVCEEPTGYPVRKRHAHHHNRRSRHPKF